jgi:hypothetical protein
MIVFDKGKQCSLGRRLTRTARNACAVTMATVVFSAWGLADGASAMEPVPASPEDRSAVQTEHEHIDPNAEGLDRFIVTFAGDSRSSEDRDRAVDVAEKAVGTSADVVRETADGSVVVATEQKLDPKESAEFMEKLAQSDTVDYVEPDSLVTIADERTGEAPKDDDDKPADPNDTMYSSLWGLHGQWGAHVPDAWKTTQGKDTTVAVLDTGITKHPDLEANLIPVTISSPARRLRATATVGTPTPRTRATGSVPASAATTTARPSPAGTAPTLPEPSPRWAITSRGSSASHPRPRSSRSGSWGSVVAAPPTSPTRSCGRRAAMFPVSRRTRPRLRSSTCPWEAATSADAQPRTRSTVPWRAGPRSWSRPATARPTPPSSSPPAARTW